MPELQAALDTLLHTLDPNAEQRFSSLINSADYKNQSEAESPNYSSIWFSGSLAVEGRRRAVDAVDVEVARRMAQSFRSLDNRHGGGRSRSLVISYIATEISPRLHRGEYSGDTQKSFYGIVAELNQLAGWMAYDVGDFASGKRHLKQAYHLCCAVQDDARASEMLAGLSHQAAFLESPHLAIDFASAAKAASRRAGIGQLRAESSVMEAHGYALIRDKTAAHTLLAEAERYFDESEDRESPEWITYFDRAYLSAKFAHCFRDLENLIEAESFARRSLKMSDGYDRGRLFNTALLASILSEQNRLEEACALTGEALDMAERVESVRSAKYFRDIALRLNRHRGNETVAGTLRRISASSIFPLN